MRTYRSWRIALFFAILAGLGLQGLIAMTAPAASPFAGGGYVRPSAVAVIVGCFTVGFLTFAARWVVTPGLRRSGYARPRRAEWAFCVIAVALIVVALTYAIWIEAALPSGVSCECRLERHSEAMVVVLAGLWAGWICLMQAIVLHGMWQRGAGGALPR